MAEAKKKPKAKLLLAGARGMLGRALLEVLADQYECVAIGRSTVASGYGEVWRAVDLRDPTALRALLASERPDVVLNSASNVFVNECESDRKGTYALHVGATEVMAEHSRTHGAKLVYISTDSVFDGSKPGLYREGDATHPLNYYAQTKLLGEEMALHSPRALVLRTNIFGWRTDDRLSFGEWVYQGIRERRSLTMFDDVTFTPISTYALARVVVRAIAVDASGLFHAGGRDHLSKYRFAVEVAKRLELSAENLLPTSVDSVDMGALRPKNTGLDSSALAAAIGEPMPALEQSLTLWLRHKPTQ